MPQFSSFTPYGFLRFAAGNCAAQRYYEAALTNIGADANFSEDANVRDKLYADAFVSGIVSATVERAANQAESMCLQELLPVVEGERGINGQDITTQTKQQRRATLARLRRLNLDGKYTTIRQALSEYLGDSLVGYRTTKVIELPAWAGDATLYKHISMENIGQPAVVLRMSYGICNPAPLVEFEYEKETLFGSASDLKEGAWILLDPGTARAERLQIASVNTAIRTVTVKTVTRAHSTGAYATTMPFENMSTSKRLHHIIVKAGVVNRRDITYGIDVIMERIVSGSAIWQIEEEDAVPLGSGPFILGTSKLGHVPFERVSV